MLQNNDDFSGFECYNLRSFVRNCYCFRWYTVWATFSEDKGILLNGCYVSAQFFLEWAFIRIPWLYNYNISGAIEVPYKEMFGIVLTGAKAEPLTLFRMFRFFSCINVVSLQCV